MSNHWVDEESKADGITDVHCFSDVLHPNRANVSKDELRTKLSELYKVSKDQVTVFGFRTQYGGGKSTGFALIYDSKDALKTFEPHYRLVRIGEAEKIEKASRQQRTLCRISIPCGSCTSYDNLPKPNADFVMTCRQATQEPSEDGAGDCQDQGCGEGQEEIEGGCRCGALWMVCMVTAGSR